MIKKIHYCWFGGKKLPKDVKKCILTWKKMLPDYEIIEWNEEKFDVNSVPFVKQAYDNKKWAFVSDYVRTYALYEQGGLYLDTDVKILKNVEDIIDKNLVFGYEDSGYFGTAVIATNIKHNPYIKDILDFYNNIKDFNVDIIYNYANPAIITKSISKYHVKKLENGIKIFNNEVYVYPRDYFYPLSYNYSEKIYTKNTCMVHLFNGTWTDKGERRTIGLYRKFGLGLGGFLNNCINSIFTVRDAIKKTIKNIFNYFRMKYSIYFNRNKRVNRIKENLKKCKENYIAIYDPDYPELKECFDKKFENNIIDIRQQYTEKEAKMIAKEIVKTKVNLVIFNSYSKGWNYIIQELKKLKPEIKIKNIVYYNNILLSDGYYAEVNKNILDMYFKEYIDELGFIEQELYEFYKNKGYNAKLLYLNKTNIENEKIEITNKKVNFENLRVGMYFKYDRQIENVYNQLSAVSLFENSKLDCTPLNYRISDLAKKYNLTLSGLTNWNTKYEIVERMKENDINLSITHSNIVPNIILESFENEVPCLVGKNSNLFINTELEQYIVVNNPNDIMEIYEKIKKTLENKKLVMKLYSNWKEQYITESNKRIEEFINN